MRPVQTFTELAAWLERGIQNLDADCNDDETMGAIGIHAHRRSVARVAAYRDVLFQIGPAVDAEAAERQREVAEDSFEARYKEAYGPDADKLGAWQAEGR